MSALLPGNDWLSLAKMAHTYLFCNTPLVAAVASLGHKKQDYLDLDIIFICPVINTTDMNNISNNTKHNVCDSSV